MDVWRGHSDDSPQFASERGRADAQIEHRGEEPAGQVTESTVEYVKGRSKSEMLMCQKTVQARHYMCHSSTAKERKRKERKRKGKKGKGKRSHMLGCGDDLNKIEEAAVQDRLEV